MPVWPYKSRDTLIESLEWLTDIIRAKGTEQRFALRQQPRRVFNLEHLLGEAQYTAARALIRQNETFLVPDWPVAVNVGSIAAGSSVAVDYDEDDLNINVGSAALLWQSSAKYEQVVIESIDSSGAVLTTVVDDYAAAWLVPLYSAESPTGLQAQRPAGFYITANIEMRFNFIEEVSDSDYATYRGHDLVDDCPVVSSASFNEPISWPVDIVDNNISDPLYFNLRNIPDAQYMMRWHPFTRSDLYTLRKFLNSRRGRWKAFWLSSFGRDFEIAEDIGAVDITVRVFAPDGVVDLGRDTFDINIRTGNNNFYRQVTSYLTGSQVNGRDTVVFTIDSDLGQPVGVADVLRISYLRCVRFNSDRIELNHQAAAGTSVAVPVLEILP